MFFNVLLGVDGFCANRTNVELKLRHRVAGRGGEWC